MTLLLRPRVVGAFVSVAAAGSACSTTNDVAGVSDPPEVSITDVSLPDVSLPDVSSPDVSSPDVSSPDVSSPDVSSQAIIFDSPTGDYRITFPGAPVLAALPVVLPGETVNADAYVYESADAAYLTSVFDYPEGITDEDAAVVLAGARDGAIDTLDGVLGTSEVIELGGIPGIKFTFALENAGQPGVGAAVVFFDDPRLYQSFALGVPTGAAAYDVFVDTFEFTGVGS